ncbi:HdeD family acid-resistance protein [Sphingopyxis sp. LK2115]|jgi:uncharacterized membrane protein HdeD (DUF308 family)|uniref:HdeD family acid-resistance protein n=1 Tax=Sphingopyxis sp. LK2115 TaxID=2744558 RepID=UPI0016615535|nr:DUF308 domain-containing protein [Sphingopyxis sp. LK2115]
MQDMQALSASTACSLSRNWWLFALRGALALIFAILAALMPGSALFAITILFGAFAFVDGIIGLAAAWRQMKTGERWGWLAFSGLTGILAGVVVIVWPLVATFALSLFLWWSIILWAVLSGALEVAAAIRLRREIKGEVWLALSGILSIVLGLAAGWFLFVLPVESFVAMGWVLAFYAALFGMTMLMLAWRLRRVHRHGGTVELVVAQTSSIS